MASIYDISEARKKKYKLNFPIGKIVFNSCFNQVVIDNDLDNFFKIILGQEWSMKSIKDAMKDGVEQVLIAWYSSTDLSDANTTIISIYMGLSKKVKYDKDSNETSTYSIYYQVVGPEMKDISSRLKTFDEAFNFFKNWITGFITGIY